MNLNNLLHHCLPALFVALSAASSTAQTDDFNDGNDAGWTKYEPLKILGIAGSSSISVTGGAYALSCEPSPNAAALGPSRAGSLRQGTSYSTFCMSVDIVNWNPAEDSSMGVLARLQPNPGPGATNGYAFTYQGQDGDVQISRVTGEDPAGVGGSPAVTLTPGESYRMVFFGIGSYLEGRIYDADDLTNPLVTVSGIDSAYTQGTCGLVIFSDGNSRCSATFDNYSAGPGTPPPLNVGLNGGTIAVSWDSAAGICHSLETTTDFLNWSALFGFTAAGGRTTYSEALDPMVPAKFYRLRLGPAGVGP